MKTAIKDLKALDQKYVWHPFTQMRDWTDEEILVIDRAEDCYLIDTEDRRYIDGVSSLWCNVHGHQIKKINQAVKDQLDKVAHSTFLGLSNVPAVLLAKKLIQSAPRGLARVFYSDSGSEAMEIALKMAYQYWQVRKNPRPKKNKFVHLELAYHGDTIGSVSVGGIDLFHQVYKPLLFETYSAFSPYCYRCKFGLKKESCKRECFQELEHLVAKHHEELVAIVVEPLVQGAAGMIDQPSGYLTKIRELADRYDVLLICDEVATGFGRTGTMFACDQESVTPDIMAVAKGITGGYLPLAATLVKEKIYEAFLGDYGEFKAFFHGHTYTANPLACAAALANLEIFEEDKTLETLQPKIALMKHRLEKIRALKHVGDVRQVGFMAGIELVRDKSTKKPYDLTEKRGIGVCKRARKYGVIMRPLGNVIVLMPPLGIAENLLEELLNVTEKCIREETESSGHC
ncbi:MAG: adenosylmethionine--8-amino-7-oxononanoate transaminase [Candidatus Omnitrophica bacterium]|nr:adenosylmethionine--8-amino-7-oxononanoate transaminase [Candidatus Omnitrophota bacterium]